jgi:hypothetical protein
VAKLVAVLLVCLKRMARSDEAASVGWVESWHHSSVCGDETAVGVLMGWSFLPSVRWSFCSCWLSLDGGVDGRRCSGIPSAPGFSLLLFLVGPSVPSDGV